MLRRAAFALAVIASGATIAAAQAKPGADSPMARERAIFAAIEKKDYPAFNEALGADFTYVEPNAGVMKWERTKSAEMLKACTNGKLALTDMKERPVGNDVMVVTYTVTGNQTCNGQKMPSVVFALSVWQKLGGRWIAVAHSETPKAAAPPAATKK
jgi:ketosteroid isomerase-like protein